MQWATQQLVSIFMIVPWKICIFHVTMYWKPLSLVCWTGVLSWVKLNKKSETKAWAGSASCWSSQVLHTTHWHDILQLWELPSSVHCGVWFFEAELACRFSKKNDLFPPYGCVSSCPTKNLLQSAQSAARRPLYFFLSPSSTHLASGDLLSQPSRVIRFPNDRKATRQESEEIDLIWFAHCHCTRSSYQTPCKQNMFLRFHIWRVIN